MSMSDRENLTDEQIAGALTELGEDVSVDRVARVKEKLARVAFPDASDSEAVKAAVDAARRAPDVAHLGHREQLQLTQDRYRAEQIRDNFGNPSEFLKMMDHGDARQRAEAADPTAVEKYIKISADSIASLRKADVFRVLEGIASGNVDGITRADLATFIANARPDLASEVEDVMNEEFPADNWAAAVAGAPDARFESGQKVVFNSTHSEAMRDGKLNLAAERFAWHRDESPSPDM
ncbi:hypothetical protein [Burkholderia arboris]|uniref:hypothetical protein n=1 Tax=Burkholderia arboris TaxID=488730 RepID=UPI001CF52899|nr:hypothetical protein [Burkholderia arboris]MCA8050905.1 hypothetical protein [Burkholderia arboris]